jgi:hypothetical protein
VPADYSIDPDRGLVSSRAWGQVSGLEFVEHQRRLSADPEFRPEYDQIWDCRDIERLSDVDAETMRRLAANNPFAAGSRRAVVSPSNATYGLSRMFEILTEESPDEFRVFRDWNEALSWLGPSRPRG